MITRKVSEPLITAGVFRKYREEKAMLCASMLMNVGGIGPAAESFVRPNALRTVCHSTFLYRA